MTQAQFDTLRDEALERLMHATSGHATVADLRELESWRGRSAAHADAYGRALGIWEALGTAAGESATALDRAMIAGQGAAGRPAVSRRLLLAGGAMAATVAAVAIVRPPLGLWPSLSDLHADYHTDAGERRTLTLAEGISVEMNTRTSIVRRSTSQDEERIEVLSGEAAISTASGALKPVTVIAGEGRVTAASQSLFNLRYDADAVRVSCLDRSVSVECRGSETILHAGEQLVYSTRGISSIAAIDPTAVAAWRRGLLIFRDEPLVRVLDEVNRYWRGRIILLNSELGSRHVTVRIELARIDEVISYIRSVLNANVRSLPGGVVLLT
jgi:transmembrane sensor